MPATATSHFADLKHVSMHYVKAGKGETVVLLHGIPQTSYEWRHIIPDLAKHYQVIAPDLRGLGLTSKPGFGYDKKTMAEDIWELLHDHLGLDTFYAVGHDWGGPVAFSLAAHHRAAVKKLAILDVVIPGDGADFSQGGRRWHHAFFRTRDLPEALCIGKEDLIIGWLFDHYGHRPNAISKEDQEVYFESYRQFGTFRAMLEIYRALPIDIEDNHNNIKEFGKLAMPVLALGGSESFGRGMECIDSMRRVAEDVTGGVVERCGHWIAEEQPDVLKKHLLDFIGL